MEIGIVCRDLQHFDFTIDYMIHNNCLNKNSIIKRTRDMLITDKCTYRPILLNRENYNRGKSFDLIISEVMFPKLIETDKFKGLLLNR